jgi:TetR/AcrR family transcriptional repressor for divergent bdcA
MSNGGFVKECIVTTKENSKSRGRPRAFDVDHALETAQALFHDRGYEGVGVAALTQALGIAPPSFYAAFGSKAGLFERVLERYAAAALPIDALLAEGREPVEALGALLESAARAYAADPQATGCLVLESARAGADPDSAGRARALKEASRARIVDFVAATHPGQADTVADYVQCLMSGLSAASREGWDEARLLGTARAGTMAIRAMLAPQ